MEHTPRICPKHGVDDRIKSGACRLCFREARRRYSEANKDKEKARAQRNRGKKYSLAHYNRHREAINAERRAKYAANAEAARERVRKYRADNPDAARESVKRYSQANPQATNVRASRRRARKRNNGGRHTVADVLNRLAQQGGLCWWCAQPVGDDYHADHIIPLAEGGSDGPENICIACPTCNQVKGAKMPLQFAGRLL
jgi:5-methylcytosine-specific restriction endonuclease McrA